MQTNNTKLKATNLIILHNHNAIIATIVLGSYIVCPSHTIWLTHEHGRGHRNSYHNGAVSCPTLQFSYRMF